MRFVLCFFGLVASALTALLGVGFLLWNDALPEILANTPAALLEILHINDNSATSLTGISYPNAALVTLAAAAYGFLGSILTMFRCGKQGGALLLIPVLGAAFINPISLAVTWFAAFIALGCFFIGPLPLNPPADKNAEDEEDEEEEEKPKPMPKAKVKPKPRKDEDDE
jgi:predicted small lipoprotein YifL